SFETDEFEEHLIVVQRHAPLFIVVAHHEVAFCLWAMSQFFHRDFRRMATSRPATLCRKPGLRADESGWRGFPRRPERWEPRGALCRRRPCEAKPHASLPRRCRA